MKKQFSTTVIIAGLIFCFIGGYIGYKYAQSIISNDLSNLNQRIDDLFHGKVVIQDGYGEIVQGEEGTLGYTLYSGGFTIYKLSNESGGYVKSKLTAGNVKWKKGEYRDNGYVYIGSAYHPPVATIYSDILKYLLKGTEDEPNSAYTMETFTEIKDFPGSFVSEYYQIKQVDHPTELYSTKNTGWETGNKTYKVNYNERKEFFSLSENKSKINTLTLSDTGFGIGGGIILTIMLSFILRFFIPATGKGESIFNKKWKDIETNFIFTIEPKLFGKNTIVLIGNEKIKKGLARITDNGDNIHLSFSDSEIFYRIKFLSTQKLEMEDLASNKLSKFELLGSNAYKKEEGVV